MIYVNKLKITTKNGIQLEFEVGKKTNFIDFWEQDAIVLKIPYKSLIDSSSDSIEIQACPEGLIGASGAMNIMKKEIESFSYVYRVNEGPYK